MLIEVLVDVFSPGTCCDGTEIVGLNVGTYVSDPAGVWVVVTAQMVTDTGTVIVETYDPPSGHFTDVGHCV